MSSLDIDTLVARLRAAGCVFAEEEAALLLAATTDPARLEALVAQRISGFPLEHLLGWAEFRGLRVAVAPGVFVPRRRTGFLVEQAVALGRDLARAPGQSVTALDMCCGCGALGMALTIELRAQGIPVRLTASDVEPAAVVCARRNLAALGARVFEGDLFAPVPAELRAGVDILLANTPYVPSAEIAHMPPEARDHEPRRALDGGSDGLDILRRIAAVATEWLAPGGQLLVEESEEQAPRAAEIMARHGLTPRIAEDEELGATVVIGTHTPTA
ncbi:putative protein N(5)-glutamine methyltransferase [Nocardia huaxiensis]|uniref:peptide chain release factor N(5)-glutamine methyltransferase n=1 Tax=Nocardia huaxiensis TaxID=2755382 RepID=A0A7D6Z111_9NOCA|nr:putative protein N(5)-glutamine methyltransferase [Nocardia huaxiensis]QLY27804.1 putative protein N(5)-glutamine methyltransferase [Nocardia huaxiensis]UFS98801.1 putative protein N(5)-glutamine methyltransferase [Nocardia huaxiensis]